MEYLISAIGQHGYSILFFVVLAEAIGLPVPAALGLLVAGGASARGTLHAGEAIGIAVCAMLIGDNLLFLLGRWTGWWLLGFLCRVSLNPEACILRSADSFYRRGRIVLIVAKFLPGINTMAPPLAGSMNMPAAQFFVLDGAGTLLYILSYFGAGFLFSGFLRSIMRGYSAVGSVAGWVVLSLFLLWLGNRLRLWLRSRNEVPVPMILPREAARRLYDNRGERAAAIYDVRSHGYYERGTMRIKGSARLEPNSLADRIESLPREKDIFLYCTCLREATAVRVARLLAERGIPSFVIEGGLSGWKKASLPLEPVPTDDMVLLPRFS
jgi:membrane protein DedA with SNARE-associated domain/rhodanese-related sulfurtransferase